MRFHHSRKNNSRSKKKKNNNNNSKGASSICAPLSLPKFEHCCYGDRAGGSMQVFCLTTRRRQVERKIKTFTRASSTRASMNIPVHTRAATSWIRYNARGPYERRNWLKRKSLVSKRYWRRRRWLIINNYIITTIITVQYGPRPTRDNIIRYSQTICYNYRSKIKHTLAPTSASAIQIDTIHTFIIIYPNKVYLYLFHHSLVFGQQARSFFQRLPEQREFRT